MPALKSLHSILLIITLLAIAAPSMAEDVTWSSMAFDEALITGSGQTFTDFAGIPGLSATISGSSNVNAPYVHQSGLLHLRSVVGTPGDIAPAVITFQFNQPVEITMGLNYFGDGNIAEQATFESFGPHGFNGQIPGGSVTSISEDSLLFESADTYQGSPATISSAALSGFTLILDGADENDMAGVTLSMGVSADPVGTQNISLQSIKAMYR